MIDPTTPLAAARAAFLRHPDRHRRGCPVYTGNTLLPCDCHLARDIDTLLAAAQPARSAGEGVEALVRHLDDKHWPTTRAKRPGFLVCDFDSMTWPCDTRKALDAHPALAAPPAPESKAASTNPGSTNAPPAPDRERCPSCDHPVHVRGEWCDCACPVSPTPAAAVSGEARLGVSEDEMVAALHEAQTVCGYGLGCGSERDEARAIIAVLTRLAAARDTGARGEGL